MSLRLTNIGHWYGASAPVLRGIELEVGVEETVAIFGPSGSGKTTLLSIIGGLLQPSEGEVTIDGLPLSKSGPGSVSWVFQGVNLLGYRTALDNVRIGFLAQGLDGTTVDERAVALLGRVGLAERAHEQAMRLSGGEAQRVGVARALAAEPHFVLADEPTGQLDHATSRAIASLLVRERPSGTSLITATHDLSLAAMCGRRYRLLDGRLEEA